MKRRFKSKKRRNRILINVLLIVILAIMISLILIRVFISKNINNNKYLEFIVKQNFFTEENKKVDSFPTLRFLLKNTFNYKEKKEVVSVNKESIEEPKNSNPIVYIYNTHQCEQYKSPLVESFNIKSHVIVASYILKEHLSNLGISSIVEENDVSDVLRANGWKYGSSYKASRILLDSARKKYPGFNYYIDIHRDSSKYKTTTITINDINYARIMFVVGLENNNYAQNLVFANKLNEELTKKYPNLVRGISKKKGKGVNGVYNQDISPNAILIEIGGVDNTIDEVNNTVHVVGDALAKYIKGEL